MKHRSKDKPLGTPFNVAADLDHARNVRKTKYFTKSQNLPRAR